MQTYQKRSICPYDCPSACGLMLTTDGERILKVDGDPKHPASSGILCRKMRHYEEDIHSAERILTPLKRTGAKGSGFFAPISWEEAVSEITGRWKKLIRQYGPESIAYCYYSGVMSSIQRHSCEALFHRMGACELIKTLCSSAKGAGYASVVGNTGCLDPRELADSDFYLVWGSQMIATRLPSLKALTEGKKAGKKVIQIEVYGEPMANYCDETIRIRPGADGALALAMMQVLAEEGFADKDYLQKMGNGYEEFRTALAADTPEWAEGITGIPAGTIRRLARLYGKANAPAIILGSGNSRYRNGGMTVRLITILSLFTGAWQRPGGGLCGGPPFPGSYLDNSLIQRPDLRKTPGRKVNINQLALALAKTPAPENRDSSSGRESIPNMPMIRSLYVCGANPADSVSDQKTLLAGLAREDLFTVVHERFLTDTARYADLILPAAFSVEQSDCYTAYGYRTLASAFKVIDPAGEAKSNWDTIRLLAAGMGYEDDCFKQTEEEMIQLLLQKETPASACLTAAEREKLLTGGALSLPRHDRNLFLTKNGRFYLVNPELAEPMPRYIPCEEELPLRLVSVPSAYTLNTVFHARKQLTDKNAPLTLILHPDDAAERGIQEGDRICAYNDLAEVEFYAKISPWIAKGAAASVGTGQLSESLNGLTANALHHARLSDMGEATTMNDNAIEVKKAWE